MIKRYYFMHAKINKCDGTGSYTFKTTLATVASLFPKTSEVYNDMREKTVADAEAAGLGCSSVEITYFGRC